MKNKASDFRSDTWSLGCLVTWHWHILNTTIPKSSYVIPSHHYTSLRSFKSSPGFCPSMVGADLKLSRWLQGALRWRWFPFSDGQLQDSMQNLQEDLRLGLQETHLNLLTFVWSWEMVKLRRVTQLNHEHNEHRRAEWSFQAVLKDLSWICPTIGSQVKPRTSLKEWWWKHQAEIERIHIFLFIFGSFLAL